MEEQKKVKTLTLPFIELEEGQDACLPGSYKERGTFFVRDNLGSIQVVSVNPLTKEMIHCVLPPIVNDYFTEEECKKQFVGFMDSIVSTLAERMNELSCKLDKLECVLSGELSGLTVSLETRVNSWEGGMDKILSAIRDEIHKIEFSDQPNKGKVSEDALLEIIKVMRR